MSLVKPPLGGHISTIATSQGQRTESGAASSTINASTRVALNGQMHDIVWQPTGAGSRALLQGLESVTLAPAPLTLRHSSTAASAAASAAEEANAAEQERVFEGIDFATKLRNTPAEQLKANLSSPGFAECNAQMEEWFTAHASKGSASKAAEGVNEELRSKLTPPLKNH